MPKAGTGDGVDGRVRAGEPKGHTPSKQLTYRFPMIAECTHGDMASVCQNTHCRYHLEHRGYGEHRLQPTRECALDVANEGEHTLDEVAAVLGVTGEYVRRLEARALRKLRRSGLLSPFDEE